MNTQIKIEEFGIVINLYKLHKNNGYIPVSVTSTITSTMHKEKMPSRENYPHSSPRKYNDESTSRSYHDAMIDAIEAMILAHAIAGIDISEEKYVNGIRAAVEAASKEYEG